MTPFLEKIFLLSTSDKPPFLNSSVTAGFESEILDSKFPVVFEIFFSTCLETNLRIVQDVKNFEIFLSFYDYEEYLTKIISNEPMKIFFSVIFY